MRFDERADGAPVQSAVALRARRPDGGPLAPVQHAELERREIGRASHDAAERVDLAHHGALGDAANGRIARHLPDRLKRARHERGTRTPARGGHGGLDARVSRPDHEDVELGLERRLRRRHP